MTNEEAIIDLSVLAERMDSKNAEIPVYDISLEAVDMAIKALEQELCEDAISRQAAIEKIHWLGLDNDTAIMCDLAIRALSSVNPQPKTGHWIVHPKGIFAHLVCDKCLTRAPYDCKTNYCPTCGVKMVEPPAESEEQA